jgi:hypothetical protein
MNTSEQRAVSSQPWKTSMCLVFLLTAHGLLLSSVWADEAVKKNDSADMSPMLEAVDIPTADVLDPKTFSTSFRFYSQGGITSRLVLGPFKRLNVGFSLDAQRLIGGDDPHMIRPSAFIKFRFFDGTDVIPAFAIGYDNQGYLYQDATRDFMQKEKGIYMVASHEIFLPDFEVHAGVNIPRVDEDGTPFGFFGATWKIVPTFALLAEYDNIQNAPGNRVNLGGRFWVTPYFNVDVAARNVGRGAGRGAERIVRLNYVTNFPF